MFNQNCGVVPKYIANLIAVSAVIPMYVVLYHTSTNERNYIKNLINIRVAIDSPNIAVTPYNIKSSSS